VIVKSLAINGATEFIPQVHHDERGSFLEWYRYDALEAELGYNLSLKQGNASVSQRGVLRGLHFADVNPGQAKYVTCVSGEVIDYIVDVRIGSPTYGEWVSVLLSSDSRNSVYIAEGLGHAFLSLHDGAALNYLVSGIYNPEIEYGINPLDSDIGLEFPKGTKIILSEKDRDAPTLRKAESLGILPSWEESVEKYSKNRVQRNLLQ
jgi:dTDP-4-dehydrorhamnose 3,5-epimerase